MNMDENLVFTANQSTPLTYNKVRENDSFDEVRNVKNNTLVMLTFANENYYLNIPQEVNEETGELETQKIQFERFEDLNDIDINGYWVIEVLETVNKNKCLLKHFNTGKYLRINDNDTESMTDDDFGEITSKVDARSVFNFEPVNDKNENINKYT